MLFLAGHALSGASSLRHYYAHPVVADRYGVIAPWYRGQNGQYDFRVRVAAETLKRYPWSSGEHKVPPAPEYLYDGSWSIDEEGRIRAVAESDWANGDLIDRAAYVLGAFIEYYRYSGDPAALTAINATANYVIESCQTEDVAPWPRILISVPTMGKRYGACIPGESEDLAKGQGKIQLDIVAEFGYELVRAYEMTGNVRWYSAAKHWGDLLALNRERDPRLPPWGRYASKTGKPTMNGVQTGGVSYILTFLDELIRTGYTGTGASIIAARDAARRYVHDVLLPAWLVDDTWGRNYWDWEQQVQGENVTRLTVDYMLDHPDNFWNWKNDCRNILSLFLNHTSASPVSNGDVYHGAWAYPESSSCCERSLWYAPIEVSSAFAHYGATADSEWAREIARRSTLLGTYDPLPNGQTNDLIDGGIYVNATWFKIAHPMALRHILKTMGWLPEVMGPNRENHIMRSSGVVRAVRYGKDRIGYSTFYAPVGSVDVLRISYVPAAVLAGNQPLARRDDLNGNGYTVRRLDGGDAIVFVRHDGATEIAIDGPDPQHAMVARALNSGPGWRLASGVLTASHAGSALLIPFTGNQVRVVAPAGARGGLADLYLDDVKQLVPVDFYCPVSVDHQILYYRNGLGSGPHTLRLVARGARDPVSSGDEVYVESVQYSDAGGDSGFGEGGGPRVVQRMIFGYPSRTDFSDSQGYLWRPATEFVVRTGHNTDTVAKAWWTMRQAVAVAGTPDPELYRYGAHWKELIVNITVAPGTYYARLKFAENQYNEPNRRAIGIQLNGRAVLDRLDVLATAGGANKAVDLVFNDITPKNGIVEIRLRGEPIHGVESEAMLQALEVGPGSGGLGATPKSAVF